MSGRPGAEKRMENTARLLLAEVNRWDKRRDEAEAKAEAARSELTELWRSTCDRFGREFPTDAFLLDVLASIEVEAGDVWRWRGVRNNKGLATIRSRAFHNQEESLVRYLAITFGVISEDEWGMLYPTNGDVDDVNPWHRTLRATDHPIGNPNRFGFQPTETPA